MVCHSFGESFFVTFFIAFLYFFDVDIWAGRACAFLRKNRTMARRAKAPFHYCQIIKKTPSVEMATFLSGGRFLISS